MVASPFSPSESPDQTLARDTIFALSSGAGKAGVAVIRVSGPGVKECLHIMTRRRHSELPADLPKPRRAAIRTLVHPTTGDTLDHALVIFFQGPHSYTGEDVAELHTHGGVAVVRAVLDALASLPQFRMADKGEFSRRAFDNDKLDLTSLEGLADLLSAETEVQRKQALRQAEGALYKLCERWRTSMVRSLALVEAVIDFGEDENIEEGVYAQVYQLAEELRGHLADNRRGEIVRTGIHLAIAGPPNAGKSTQRQVAIVSDQAGTTRDVIESTLDIGGYPVVISDTAGIRESGDTIEMEGVRRAKERLAQADLRLILVDAHALLDSGQASCHSAATNRLTSTLQHIGIGPVPGSSSAWPVNPDLIVLNKWDLVPPSARPRLLEQLAWHHPLARDGHVVPLSCLSQDGFTALLDRLTGRLRAAFDTADLANPGITQVRHRQHLHGCLEALENFLELEEADVVLAAEELRRAAHCLGQLTGRTGVEQILDALFSQFCIGK
ncbi:tRNA modification GTPase gtpbp3, mitochondrial [Tieghemiomyces parasiticus]|uniref:tRNA modification GTPase gtpbp3, mitochondrial n=1 Tax=Tieghemiomyces parasiticus TaxID=78921 RepID=A0A9W8ADC8_9FUNG|nr:tRNA modification GTPase gtpbp3, mitochondrial [Tieghemiomyces parasiticus]